MVGDLRLSLHPHALDALEDDEEVLDMLMEIGDEVAETAATLAPKASGAGAASIHAEPAEDADGTAVDVSWDRDHFYMGFHELGTEKMAARPFLRPALDQTRI